jgi:hypothetical protein
MSYAIGCGRRRPTILVPKGDPKKKEESHASIISPPTT